MHVPQASCSQCESKERSLFCDLDPEAHRILEQNKVINRYKKGQYIFYAGNTPTGLFCLNKGSVHLEVDGPLGKGHILRVVKAGGVLGYRSLFANENYSASAVAHDDCEICLITKEGIQKLMEHFPQVALRLLQQVSKELRSSEERFCSMTDKTAPERVAESLLYLKESFQDQSWTRREIADWAGTTTETVIRSLSDFEKQGLIEQKGRKINILKKQELADHAQMID